MIDDERFRRAFDLALELHGRDTRKGTDIPYMGHLLGVTSIVIDDGGSESEVLAALLHDGPEDAGGEETLERIRTEFGDEVAEIVDHLSDTFEDPKPPWKQRKENYLADLRAMPTDDLGRKVLRVSLADKLHNVRSIHLDQFEAGDEIWDRFNATKEQNLWYYRTLAAIYKEKLGQTALTNEFLEAIARLASRGQVTVSISRERWDSMVASFDEMLEKLTSSEPHRHGQRPAPPKFGGIYLFAEEGRPVYVGITRNLQARYGQHQRPSSPENSAPFAFAIARREAEAKGFPVIGRGRVELSIDPEFAERFFSPAKDRVRAMDFHYLTVPAEDLDSDPKIAVFEVFAAIVLGTEGDFNSFRTH